VCVHGVRDATARARSDEQKRQAESNAAGGAFGSDNGNVNNGVNSNNNYTLTSSNSASTAALGGDAMIGTLSKSRRAVNLTAALGDVNAALQNASGAGGAELLAQRAVSGRARIDTFTSGGGAASPQQSSGNSSPAFFEGGGGGGMLAHTNSNPGALGSHNSNPGLLMSHNSSDNFGSPTSACVTLCARVCVCELLTRCCARQPSLSPRTSNEAFGVGGNKPLPACPPAGQDGGAYAYGGNSSSPPAGGVGTGNNVGNIGAGGSMGSALRGAHNANAAAGDASGSMVNGNVVVARARALPTAGNAVRVFLLSVACVLSAFANRVRKRR
jgi:hypothetical protein